MGLKFGTSGLRGLVTEMTDEVCAAHAAAFLRHLRRSGGRFDAVLVGEDLRPSSPRIAAACRRAIRGEGAAAIACGVVPTPALALEAARRGVPAIMVTGSHIPFDRNGLKFYRPDGEITKTDEAGLIAALSEPSPQRASRSGGTRRRDRRALRRTLRRFLRTRAARRTADRRLRPQRRRARPDGPGRCAPSAPR